MTKFGIIIPNYNKTSFLPTAVESVLHQTVNKEIIIIDGGSKDGIEKVIEEYGHVIDYYISEKDDGQSHAIEKGTRQTNADIFCWLNSDDYYFPYCLDCVADIFDNHPDIDVVYGDAVHVSENGSFISYFHPVKRYNKSRLPYDNYICQPACFVRRKVYENAGGIKKELCFTMDWDLWCRLSKMSATFRYLKQPLAAVRYYKGTKTFTNSPKRYWEICRINLKYGHFFFPFSVIGANYYELSLKKTPNFFEAYYIKLIRTLRYLTHRKNSDRIDGSIKSTLYGFEKWTNKVYQECHILIPWYSKFYWHKIYFNVDNSQLAFEFKNSNKIIEHRVIDQHTISIRVTRTNSALLKITIRTKDNRNWHLKKVFCDETSG